MQLNIIFLPAARIQT